jgi:predicted esterase
MTGIPASHAAVPALHAGQPLRHAGAPLDGPRPARAAMVMVHGRGGSADDILSLAELFGAAAEGWAFVAPQAANGTWYPERFMAPMERNEPWLSSALETVGRTVAHVEGAGIASDRIVLLGFSQGACLMSEWAARHARRFGGIAALSGGLIGPEGTPRDYAGSLDGTPVLLGCSDRDPHIPEPRVRETATVLERLGARVDLRIYPNAPHGIFEDEIAAVASMMGTVAR